MISIYENRRSVNESLRVAQGISRQVFEMAQMSIESQVRESFDD